MLPRDLIEWNIKPSVREVKGKQQAAICQSPRSDVICTFCRFCVKLHRTDCRRGDLATDVNQQNVKYFVFKKFGGICGALFLYVIFICDMESTL